MEPEFEPKTEEKSASNDLRSPLDCLYHPEELQADAHLLYTYRSYACVRFCAPELLLLVLQELRLCKVLYLSYSYSFYRSYACVRFLT